MTKDKIDIDYKANVGIANEFKLSLIEQLNRILSENDVALGVPIEGRVKTIDSLIDKLERKSIDINAVAELDDFIGIRIILLFKRDLDLVTSCLKKKFLVLHEEDKLDDLDEDKFGYQSRHYILKIPDSWLQVPTYNKFGEFKAEIQVRTLAQHIWAAASHKLQYKHEGSVPLQLRRAINRASAMLEVIDLEFERILMEREGYVNIIEAEMVRDDELSNDRTLDIESLRLIAKKYFPSENDGGSDDYDALLSDIRRKGINTVGELISIIDEQFDNVMADERNMAALKLEQLNNGQPVLGTTDLDRVRRGVFFSYVGLLRKAVRKHFDDDYVSLQ